MANPTIGATTPRIQYTATASQTVFTVPFEFLANADLAVYVNGTLKTLTTDYTLTGANTTGGGTLTFVTGRTAGEIVTILGNLAYSRNTNKYTKYGLLPAEVLEADFDALQVQGKQLARDGQFALRAPLTDTGSPAMTLPVVATRSSKMLGFDASGNPVVSSSTLIAMDSAVTAINTIAAAPSGNSASISHIAAGTGATPTTVQAKLREVVSVKDFGAVGDGVADDTAAIQTAIDYAIYTANIGRIYIPSGRYKITDTIHLGYGISGYSSITIEGDACGYRGESNFASTVIIATFRDRPAIAVQGARNTRISRLCVLGQDRSYIDAGPGVSTNIRDRANWINPASANTRFAVYCGIAVDPYSGARPGTSYPDVTYPAIVGGGSVPQYNKNYSSDVLIDNCYILGFVVGLAVQPCNADGNGDFVRVDHTVFEYLAIGVAVGNTQARLNRYSYCQFTRLHTAFNNRDYGRAGSVGLAGAFNSHVDSCEFRSATQILDCNPALMAPMVFTSCYGESLWRIGSIRVGASRASNLVFNGCQFQFSWQTTDEKFGVPDYLLQTDASQHNITFNNCTLTSYWSVLVFWGAGVVNMNGCDLWLPNPDNICSSPIAAKSALNYLLGGVYASLDPVAPGSFSIKTDTRWDLSTGSSVGGTSQIMRGDFESSATRNLPLSKYAKQAVYTSGLSYGERFFVSDCGSFYPLQKSISTVTLTGRTLTVDNATSLTYANALIRGGLKGDVIYDANTGSVFFVTGHSGTTVTAELMNNFYIDGSGTVQYITAISTTAGYFYLENARRYVGTAKAFASSTSGSRVVTGAARDDGASVTSALAEGDAMFTNSSFDRTFLNNPVISTQIATTGDITSGTNTLTVGVTTIQNGFGITVAGAGAAGATLTTTVSSGGGTVNLVLANNASTTVSGAAVVAGGLVGNGIIVVEANATRTKTNLPLNQFIRQPVT